MALNGTTDIESPSISWFSSEVECLQEQMTALQTAMEASRLAVEQFQQRAAANLEASEKRYAELFENVLTGVYQTTRDGRIQLANPAFVRLLGYSRVEEIEEYRWEPPPGLQHNERILGFERTLTRRDGRSVVLKESCRAVRDNTGAITGYEGVVEDITAYKKAALFEADCRNLLERVARNEPLPEILEELVKLVEGQASGSVCTILLTQEGLLQHAAGSPLPARSREALGDGLLFGAGSTFGDPTNPGSHSAIPAPKAWTYPVSSGRGDLLGAIITCRSEPHFPPPGEVASLETICKLGSIAIEHRRLCDDLARQASRDVLTGLPNRTMLETHLSQSLNTCDNVALLCLDLDRFKEINDSLGHPVGDELIAQVAGRLRLQLPKKGMLARMGGDEFAVLLPGLDSDAAECLAGDILHSFEAPFQLNGFELFVTGSIGIAIYPEHGLSAPELQQNADAAMYRAKNQGRNAYALYDVTLSVMARERMELAHNLRRALERKELELEYQPQVDLSGTLRGMEALVRWRHPSRGLLSPGVFIEIAEETGLIVPIGSWVIEEACRQCVEWNLRRAEPIRVAVNVSAMQFYFSDLVDVVRKALDKTGLPPECLELELTESLVVRDALKCALEMGHLRSLGVTLAIDDFGTGYSSLSYLQRLPLDVLKIDRSFMENLESRQASAVLEAITTLAHSLNLHVVAEGVERADQVEVLRRLGIDRAQGFLISRPKPPQDLSTILEGKLSFFDAVPKDGRCLAHCSE